jgi:hypothetical protein
MIDPANPEETLANFRFAWGVYDTKDDCWIGNDRGPLLYTGTEEPPVSGQLMAMAAATIANDRMMFSCRFRARLFTGGPMRQRDEIEFRRSAEESVRRIEQRADPD